jgi:excisionase family DNA binding protein
MLMREENREVLNLRQAAHYLGITPDTLYKHVAENASLPAFKIGNRWRFKKSLLDRWMDEQMAQRVAG